VSVDHEKTIHRLSHVPGIRGALIVEADAGVPVVAELAEGVNGTAIAALASSLYRRTANAAAAAEFGELATMQLDAAEGHIIAAGRGDLLVVLVADPEAQLGLIRFEAQRAAERLA
jgi:predicted regulator of Ras-like GTPase activity (Roadblock/LC7/MglB family)